MDVSNLCLQAQFWSISFEKNNKNRKDEVKSSHHSTECLKKRRAISIGGKQVCILEALEARWVIVCLGPWLQKKKASFEIFIGMDVFNARSREEAPELRCRRSGCSGEWLILKIWVPVSEAPTMSCARCLISNELPQALPSVGNQHMLYFFPLRKKCVSFQINSILHF